jgi:hypothetical protein
VEALSMKPATTLLRIVAAACLAAAGTAAAAPIAEGPPLWQRLGLQPGRWHSTITMVSAEVTAVEGRPAVPAAVEAALKSKVGSTTDGDDCLGASKPLPSLVLPGIHVGDGCSYDDVSVAGGRLAFSATCRSPGFEAEAKGEGRYAADSLESTVTLRSVSAAVGGRLVLTVRVRSTRTGECRGSAQP